MATKTGIVKTDSIEEAMLLIYAIDQTQEIYKMLEKGAK